jgi:hypothetical protein
MKRVFRQRNSRQAAVLGVAVLMAALAVTGCGRNEGALPSGYVPEGVQGEESFLFVAFDSVAGNSISTAGPGVTVTVIDRTNADGYRIYRRPEGNDAFDQAVDYVGPFEATYNKGYQIFQVLDRDWQENRGVDYVGRATILGNESKLSPLSTVGRVPAGTFDDLIARPFNRLRPFDEAGVSPDLTFMYYCDADADPDCIPSCSFLFNEFSWEPFPGAVRYLLQVIRTDGVLALAALTPPDGSTSFNVVEQEGLIIQGLLPFSPSTFFWLVEAIDADSRVVGYTPGLSLFGVIPSCLCDPMEECPPE